MLIVCEQCIDVFEILGLACWSAEVGTVYILVCMLGGHTICMVRLANSRAAA